MWVLILVEPDMHHHKGLGGDQKVWISGDTADRCTSGILHFTITEEGTPLYTYYRHYKIPANLKNKLYS